MRTSLIRNVDWRFLGVAFSLLAGLLCSAGCQPALGKWVILKQQTELLNENELLSVEIDQAAVNVQSGNPGEVEISLRGRDDPGKDHFYRLDVTRWEGNVEVKLILSDGTAWLEKKPEVEVRLKVPPGVNLDVQTKSGGISLEGVRGNIKIATVGGDILADRIGGDASLISNRGNIRVSDSQGIVRLVGNYGLLSAGNVIGIFSASTIMGEVEYRGKPGLNDEINLETDHGGVLVELESESSLSINVNTTSGEISCMIPEVDRGTRSCTGRIGEASAALSIRTVSGAIRLVLLP